MRRSRQLHVHPNAPGVVAAGACEGIGARLVDGRLRRPGAEE